MVSRGVGCVKVPSLLLLARVGGDRGQREARPEARFCCPVVVVRVVCLRALVLLLRAGSVSSVFSHGLIFLLMAHRPVIGGHFGGSKDHSLAVDENRFVVCW